MFSAPYFDAGYYPTPYFPKPIAFTPPTNPKGAYFPSWYFGFPNAPGNFWVIGQSVTPTPTPSPVGGGGGWDVVKNRRALQRENQRLAIIREDDETILRVIKSFLKEIQ